MIQNKEILILVVIAFFGTVSTSLGIFDSIDRDNALTLSLLGVSLGILTGIMGGMQFYTLILYSFLLLDGSLIPLVLILCSIPLIIYFTKNIQLKKRIPYVYFFVTYLTLPLSFLFQGFTFG